MQKRQKEQTKWQKTRHANLLRNAQSGTYYLRAKIAGKLIWRSLQTKVESVAVLRLADHLRELRGTADLKKEATDGKMTFAAALAIYQERLEGNVALKPRSKEYRRERISALLKSWPDLAQKDVRKITKNDCLEWSSRFGRNSSPTAYNNTIGTLRQILDIPVELGVCYQNPATHLKKAPVRPKPLRLPEPEQFEAFVVAIENAGTCSCRQAAILVKFLAFGGFRKGEAARILWADCDFKREKILVRGDENHGTKNGSFREVPMIPEMRQLLEVLREARSTDTPHAPVMPVKECQITMNKAAAATGMRRITHHDLRHLFATRCIESGVDIPTVSRWLGHKDGGALAMKVYGHLRDRHSVEMAKRVSFAQPKNENILPMKTA